MLTQMPHFPLLVSLSDYCALLSAVVLPWAACSTSFRVEEDDLRVCRAAVIISRSTLVVLSFWLLRSSPVVDVSPRSAYSLLPRWFVVVWHDASVDTYCTADD